MGDLASEERERREEGGGKGYHRTEYVLFHKNLGTMTDTPFFSTAL
jgi:hypothetical protein